MIDLSPGARAARIRLYPYLAAAVVAPRCEDVGRGAASGVPESISRTRPASSDEMATNGPGSVTHPAPPAVASGAPPSQDDLHGGATA